MGSTQVIAATEYACMCVERWKVEPIFYWEKLRQANQRQNQQTLARDDDVSNSSATICSSEPDCICPMLKRWFVQNTRWPTANWSLLRESSRKVRQVVTSCQNIESRHRIDFSRHLKCENWFDFLSRAVFWARDTAISITSADLLYHFIQPQTQIHPPKSDVCMRCQSRGRARAPARTTPPLTDVQLSAWHLLVRPGGGDLNVAFLSWSTGLKRPVRFI